MQLQNFVYDERVNSIMQKNSQPINIPNVDLNRQNNAARQIQKWWKRQKTASKINFPKQFYYHSISNSQKNQNEIQLQLQNEAAKKIQKWWRDIKRSTINNQKIKKRSTSSDVNNTNLKNIEKKRQDFAAKQIQKWWRKQQ